jgi:hypothetical protein
MKYSEGFVYGDYLLTKYLGKQTWEAQCQKCGLVRSYKTANIKPEKATGGQCTCSKSGVQIGDRFGRLVVLNRDLTKQGEGRVYWNCQCDCGNVVSLSGKVLKSGNTRSCGCLNDDVRRERIIQFNETQSPDLTGQKSGLLTAIRKATKEETLGRPQGIGYWYCQCECGNYHIVGTNDFTREKVQSCGCLNSKGEAKITSILTENGIDFIKQFIFEDLIGNMGRHYAFDFAVFENNKLSYLIEYDGIQHYSPKHQFSQDETAFEIIQNRDNTKNEYALSHNIPLIRIPYTQFDNLSIEDLQIQTTKFLLQKEGDY